MKYDFNEYDFGKTIDKRAVSTLILDRKLGKQLKFFIHTENKFKSKDVPTRKESNPDFNWDLTKLFPDDESWEADLAHFTAKLAKIDWPKDSLDKGVKEFSEAMSLYLSCMRRIEKIYTYAHLRHDEDTTENKYMEYYNKARNLYVQLGAKMSFYMPELVALPEETLQSYYEEQPNLRFYTHFLEELRLSKEHVLSDKEEELLAKASKILSAAGETYDLLCDADMSFADVEDSEGRKHKLSIAEFGVHMKSNDRIMRRNSFKSMYNSYKEHRYSLASLYASNVDKQNFLAEVRGFNSALEAALFYNNIPVAVYENLVQAVNEELGLLHRYVNLRKNILGYEELHSYDLYVPLVATDFRISFTEAEELLLEALAPLGEEYVFNLRRAFSERWIDVYENKGKSSGAYSSGCYDSVPYILMNWKDDLTSLYTLAHELGHSMHSFYSRSSQEYLYGDYGIFLAEIASTTNENLLTAYLLSQEKYAHLRRYILNYYLEGFRTTLYRQTQFAEFERDSHAAAARGEVLSSEFLCAQYSELIKRYYGNGLTFDEEIAYEWSRIPHFYNNFYVYQYATGYSAATAFAKRLLSGDELERERYLGYLRAGSSEYPLDVLKKAGLDMSSVTPIKEALSIFGEYLELLTADLEQKA